MVARSEPWVCCHSLVGIAGSNMLQTYKIATLNIDGMLSNTKMSMLVAFLETQDIDVALLQEVTNTDFTIFTDYIAIVNEVTENRGTAILAKSGTSAATCKTHTIGKKCSGNV